MMALLAFAARHLLRHWRLHLIILLFLLLASALVAGLPMYAKALAADGLRQAINEAAPSERNVLLTASTYRNVNLSSAAYGDLQDALGDLVKERLEVRDVMVDLRRSLSPSRDLDKKQPTSARLYAFDALSSYVRIVDGRWPEHVEPKTQAEALFHPPVLEATIGARSAAKTGLTVGDWLTATSGAEIRIVGIVAPLDLSNDVWWGLQAPFDFRIPFLGDEDVFTLPLITPLQSLRTHFVFHQASWRVLLDQEQITADRADSIEAALTRLQTRMQVHRIQTVTGVPEFLVAYRRQLATARMSLLLLSAQSFVFVLYALAMMASFLLDRSQGELVTLAGRGAGRLQITLVFASEFLATTLLAAVLLGPLVARAAINLWSITAGSPPTWEILAESRYLALLAAGVSWLALVIPVYFSSRIDLLEWQRQVARPAGRAGWQRLYLDVLLLAFGGVVYWQLTESGSFVLRRAGTTQFADPLLLLGPSLLLIAVALIFLRVFPYVLRLATRLTRSARGLILPIGLARLSRDPRGPSRVVLLISLAVGLILFANAFENSLTVRQTQAAHYLAGADLRLSLPEESVDAVGSLPGVLAASPVLRAELRTEEQRLVNLVAVDPETFGRVARYPPDFTNLTIPSVLGALQPQTDPEALPAVVSTAALPKGVSIGDQFTLSLAGRQITLDVRGSIFNFPAISGSFVIVSLPDLAEMVDLVPVQRISQSEVWLAVQPEAHGALASQPSFSGQIVGDAMAQFELLRADALARGAIRAFRLNALTLAVLSVAAFVLVHYFAARQRTYEFSILRAAGAAPQQLLVLLVTEGLLVMGLGLLAGTGIGYGLSRIMVGYLSPVLSAATAGAPIRQIVIDWSGVVRQYALLVSAYLVAMLALLLVLLRAGVHRVLRMGEE
jgi:putative ABC transport system permease protein